MGKENELKIEGLKVENFKGVEVIDVKFDGGHTRIIGLNGDGKTTLIDAIQACCKGVGKNTSKGEVKGERFRFIGPHGATSNVITTLIDSHGDRKIVINKLSKAANGISFTDEAGNPLDKQWLNDFFNTAFLSAKNFTSKSPQEQSLLLGIDTCEYDDMIKILKEDATEIRRDQKAVGTVVDMGKIERVSLQELSQEKDRIAVHNREQDERQKEIDTQHEHILECESNVASKERDLQEAKDQLKGSKEFIKGMLVPKGHLVITDITDKIASADETNRQAEAYEANEKKRATLKIADDKLAKNITEQDKETQRRTDYIKSFKFPLKGLTVDETGGLLINGLRLNELSKGEQEVLVANLYKSINPELKVRIIDEFQSLDKNNQERIVTGLVDEGFQVITLEVGNEKKGAGSILLKNCKVVDEYETAEDNRPEAL